MTISTIKKATKFEGPLPSHGIASRVKRSLSVYDLSNDVCYRRVKRNSVKEFKILQLSLMIPKSNSQRAIQVRHVASIFPGVRLDELKKVAAKWLLSQSYREWQWRFWITVIGDGAGPEHTVSLN